MRQLLVKELREVVWAPLGLLGLVGVTSGIMYLQHWWGDGFMYLYMMGASLLALYLGAEAVSGEREGQFAQWQLLWPVSRLKWWLLKFTVNLVVTLIVGGLIYVLLGWVAQHNAPEAMKKSYSTTHLGLLAVRLLPTFIMAFFCSSFSRTAMQAFGVAIGLSLGSSVLFAIPSLMWAALKLRNGAFELPPPYLTLLPTALLIVAPLAGSLYSFLKTPPLEYGRRAANAFKVAALIVVPGTVVMMIAVAASTFLVKPTPTGAERVTLSPDGQRIVFRDGAFVRREWMMNSDGTGLRMLLRGQPEAATWLADSRRIVYCTPVPVVSKGPNGRRSRSWSSGGDVQWWVVDTTTKRPVPQQVIACKHTGNETATVSPTGKYLLLDGTLVEVDTWKAVGKIEMPRYTPWLQLWLSDDSAIYVREHGDPRLPAKLMRIAIPSGEKTEAKLGAGKPGQGRGVSFVGRRGEWVWEDRTTWIPKPRSQWRRVTRMVSMTGPGGKPTQRSMTYDTNTGEWDTGGVLRRRDGSRRFVLKGLAPMGGGMSPNGRYCLCEPIDEGGNFNLPIREGLALVDLQTGKVVRRYDLPRVRSDDFGQPQWSRDEQTVALTLSRWSGSHDTEVYLLPMEGEIRPVKLPSGTGISMGTGGPIGWTAGGELLATGGGNLIAINTAGQQRVLVEGKDPFDAIKKRIDKYGNSGTRR